MADFRYVTTAPEPAVSGRRCSTRGRGCISTPWRCSRRGGSAVVDTVTGEVTGVRCDSRGCLMCHRRKLRRWFDGVLDDFPPGEGESTHGLVLTPADGWPSTRADVGRFLDGVSRTLRAWVRSGHFSSVWWVAETVPRSIAEHGASEEPCPACIVGDGREGLGGLGCRVCGGGGRLPFVHLHAHVVVHAAPFAYGIGGRGATLRGGRTFQDVATANGLGHCEGQQIAPEHMAVYLAKGTSDYLCKSVKEGVATSYEDGRVVKTPDYDFAGRAALLALAWYGKRRARGRMGSAPNVRLGDGPPPKVVDDSDGNTGGNGLGDSPGRVVALLGSEQYAEEARRLLHEQSERSFARRATARRLVVSRTVVLNKAQSDSCRSAALSLGREPVPSRHPQLCGRFTGGAGFPAPAYLGAPLIGADEWFMAQHGSDLLVGRGQSVLRLPGGAYLARVGGIWSVIDSIRYHRGVELREAAVARRFWAALDDTDDDSVNIGPGAGGAVYYDRLGYPIKKPAPAVPWSRRVFDWWVEQYGASAWAVVSVVAVNVRRQYARAGGYGHPIGPLSPDFVSWSGQSFLAA